jgi:threonine synthase
LHICERQPGQTGDPCYAAFLRAVEQGAVPFCVQGPANGLTIDGGETLGFEMADAVRDATGLDALVVQVGGGALASACSQALDEAHRLGVVARRPRLYTVQTRGGSPLKRAYDAVVRRVVASLGRTGSSPPSRTELAATLAGPGCADSVTESMRYAAAHPAEFMWPWETEPRSIATGILDDETYDWLALVEGMLRTGGFPLVVSEEELEGANELARRATGIDVDHTGSAGLAGLVQLRAADSHVADQRVAVLFTGVRR